MRYLCRLVYVVSRFHFCLQIEHILQLTIFTNLELVLSMPIWGMIGYILFTNVTIVRYKCFSVYVVARFHFCLQNRTFYANIDFDKSQACVIDAHLGNDWLYFVYKITLYAA
jgi:hypothetical protein